VWQFWKKFRKILAIGLLVFGLLTPLLLFLNRVLEPDVSCDSLNYHLYLGFKGWDPGNNKYEFFPTGIHNFSPVLEMVGYGFFKILGYRLGTIFSVIAIYLTILGIYKIFLLILPGKKIMGDLWNTFLFVSSFLSFELFLGIGSYFNDVLVALLTIWSMYFLLKYFANSKFKDLAIASGLMSLSVLGKQTNLYMAIAFGIVLIVDLMMKRSGKKFKMLILTGLIVISLPGCWYFGNWRATGNPVFPFYNEIFKSKYFPLVNLGEPNLGGANLKERVLWGYYSIFNTARLGQVHDLFHDFKINLYFIFGGLLTIYYVINIKIKDKLTSRLLIFYWVGFLVWSVQFGYLRYALALEFFGGLLILIFFNKLDKYKYLIFVPVCLWLLLQNKRVINMSLAYDISFRPGYFYDRQNYFKNLPDLFDNNIKVKSTYQADIYLNCAVTGMTYYVVSPYNNLPVFNIDQNAYHQMTNDPEYMAEQRTKIESILKDNQDVKFVTIAAKTGLNTEYSSCVSNLVRLGFLIDTEEETDFVSYSAQKLGVIYGTIPRDLFDKIGN
jgi:hypothetical protein